MLLKTLQINLLPSWLFNFQVYLFEKAPTITSVNHIMTVFLDQLVVQYKLHLLFHCSDSFTQRDIGKFFVIDDKDIKHNETRMVASCKGINKQHNLVT